MNEGWCKITVGEIKGTLFSIVLLVGIVIPGLLSLGIDALHNQKFMKTTAEIADLVEREGGVTGAVTSAVSGLDNFSISFSTGGLAEYGETIHIDYHYTYRNVFGEKTLTTSNKVFNMHRKDEDD